MSNKTKYTWKDLVCIDGKVYAEEHPISGEREGEDDEYWDIDEFLEAVSSKYHCPIENIKTYMMDGPYFAGTIDMSQLAFGAESCGAYINGVAEWAIDDDEDEEDE